MQCHRFSRWTKLIRWPHEPRSGGRSGTTYEK